MVSLQSIDRSLIELALRESEERHELLFHCAPGPMWVFDVDTLQILAVNEAALAQYRYSRDEFLELTLRELRSQESRAALWRAHTSLRAGHEIHGVYQHMRRDRSLLDVEVRTSTLPVGGGQLRLILATDITEQKRGTDAARFLDKASGILMASLEFDFLCRNLAALAVPALGDWCIVHRLTGGDTIASCGYAHADPLRQSLVADLIERRGKPGAAHPVYRAWQQASVVELTGELAAAAVAGSLGEDELLQLLGATSTLFVPILGHRGTLGVLECVTGDGQPAHDASTRALAIALAERAALAMDNAVRYAEMRSAAIAGVAPRSLGRDTDPADARWILESIPDAYIQMSGTWIITDANAEAERTLGRPRDELVGQLYWSLFPGAAGTRFEVEFRRAMDEQRPVMFEEYYPGLESWYEVHARPVADGLAIFFRDVSHHRRALQRMEDSDAQYRDFLDSATDLIHMLTPEGGVVFANRAWRETLGYREDEIAALNVLDVVAPESLAVARQTIEACLKGQPLPEQELVVLTKDQRRITIRGRANCRFQEGRAISTRGIYRDVTTEVEANKLLAQARRTEAASERARTAFLDRMSHEMRTPLTAVIGFASILEANRAGRLQEKELEFARRIGAQGRNLLTIVEDVLAYAEIESRRVDLTMATVDLRATVRAVLALYTETAASNGTTLDVELPDVAANIDTDSATVQRILRYLMSDAVSRTVGDRVIVTLRADAGGRPDAIIVCAEARAELHDGQSAQQSDPAAALELGLSIAQSLAHVLGYELTFERLGGGTTVRTLQLRGLGRVSGRLSDESAKTLHAVLDASPLPIIAFDADLTVRLWNKAAEQLFGWSASEAIDHRLGLLRSDDDAGFRNLLRTALDCPQGVTDAPSVHLHRDGREIDVRVALAPLRAPDGRLRGFLSIITDVTAQKRLEQELRQAQKMEVVGRLAGGIAHAFNNLLTVISAHAQFLLGDLAADSESAADAIAIQEAAERAAALTRQLLTFSRKEVLQRRRVDINRKLANTERMLRRIIGSHIEFVTVPSAVPLSVHADPAQMEQVLMNLVLNARDAMPRGGALVVETAVCDAGPDAVARGEVPKAGQYALITVSDTGIGMDDATRQRIFEPFFTTKAESRGTGLGLATVYAIVTDSGGSVKVESAPGAGSTFRVWLPLDTSEASAGAVVMERQALRGTETVLVVEDQDAVRAVAMRVLKAYGYTVLSARHGNDALDIVRESGGGIALLLTDLVMPEMPGNELAARVRLLAPDIRVLFMSGYSETPAGLSEHDVDIPLVRKPFSGEELARAVRATLDAVVLNPENQS